MAAQRASADEGNNTTISITEMAQGTIDRLDAETRTMLMRSLPGSQKQKEAKLLEVMIKQMEVLVYNAKVHSMAKQVIADMDVETRTNLLNSLPGSQEEKEAKMLEYMRIL